MSQPILKKDREWRMENGKRKMENGNSQKIQKTRNNSE